MGSNVCDCPQPPGGQVSCGANQIAICRVVNGVVRSFCMDPPDNLRDLGYFQALPNAKFIFDILYQVTGEERWRGSKAPFREALNILKKGYYKNAATGVAIQLKLPRQFFGESTDDELEELEA